MSHFFKSTAKACTQKKMHPQRQYLKKGARALFAGLLFYTFTITFSAAESYVSDQPMRSVPEDNRPFDLRVIEWVPIDPSTLPLSYAFKRVQGKGERIVYFFTDIDCPYCVKFENTIKKIDNITVYTFMLPLPNIHPDGPRKSTLIWCADSPAQAWDTFYNHGGLPSQSSHSCTAPLAEIRALANKLGIGEEPAVIFADGQMATGKPFIYATLNARTLDTLLDIHQASDK